MANAELYALAGGVLLLLLLLLVLVISVAARRRAPTLSPPDIWVEEAATAAPVEPLEGLEPLEPLEPPEPRFPTVLVTGAGGAAGVCVIRALKAMGVRVVAADSDDTAVGLHLGDGAGLVGPADRPGFVESVCDLARTSGAGALVSTVSEELPVLAEARGALAGAGLATWLPDPVAARAYLDRWELARALAAAEIAHPQTGNGEADGVAGPWIVKPRVGRGSRGFHVIDSAADMDWVLEHMPAAIVQTRLEGIEFTIDALVDRDGTLAAAVPRWRLETTAGVSTKGRTFEDPLLIEQTRGLLAAVGLDGPVTIHGFLLSASGLYSFTGVKPRFSGGLSLSLAAGADLVGEYLRGILGLPVRRENLGYQPGVTMERFYEDVILRPSSLVRHDVRMEEST